MRESPPIAMADWAYFLDMDGTLIEIAESPAAVSVDAALLNLIRCLHLNCRGAVALISGRSLADLEQHMGGSLIPMAGQHGLERRDASGHLHVFRSSSSAKYEIQGRLEPLLERHPNVILEDKGFSMALHYRRALPLAGYLHRVMRRLLSELGEGLHLQKGKRVIELRPEGFDKGKAVDAYLSESPFLGRRPVFIGDDLTDETAFSAVNRRGGFSIKVGEGPSCAQYGLPDVKAVREWLASAAGVPP
ncbi:MAG TPA: trehalose-phosphatase [Rhodocyclaceae bacterium]|nr:trehalose-phosphatase [Rhodocyclaceae bacterium]